MAQLRPPVADTPAVEEFMAGLVHPFKAEVQALRDIIKGVNQEITEEIKWKAPTFGYGKHYLLTFNLRAQDRIHLVFHHPDVARVESPLLEGSYEDRRMAYFSNLADVRANRAELERVLRELIELSDKAAP